MYSMTGFGAASREVAGGTLTVEVKAVNGRFLKVNVRLPASLQSSELALEALVKARLRRGSITMSVHFAPAASAGGVQVDEAAVAAYVAVFTRLGVSTQSVPTLPGVLAPADTAALPAGVEAALQAVGGAALDALQAMRVREGQALAEVLRALCARLEGGRQAVRARAPAVVGEYQTRLHERVAVLLSGTEVPVAPEHLAREVALFADRCDITEEVDRLGVHLAAALELLGQAGEVGRTLDFLAQEMHREVNTMGSKSNDAALAREVVALKADVERLKEQVANLE